MKKDTIALIITVKNEAQAIEKLLESVASQTTQPDEVIIADAGSADQTQSRIKAFKNQLPQLTFLDAPGSNRSQGRNQAITLAKSNIIAVTDAGCVLKNDWLAIITAPILARKADSVAGFYLPDYQTVLQRTIAPFVAVMPDKLDIKNYLPSSRSVAFTKDAWEKAGRYPEDLNYCEDLVFADHLKHTSNLRVEPQAIVYWRQVDTLAKFYRQIQNYAIGDIHARHRPHLIKIASVFLRYGLFILFPPLFFVYLFWPIYKHARYIAHPASVFLLPILQIITDLAIMTATIKAVL